MAWDRNPGDASRASANSDALRRPPAANVTSARVARSVRLVTSNLILQEYRFVGVQDSDVRHEPQPIDDGPTHPWIRATLLMVGVVVLLLALSVSSVVR
jgi:hypothetical protein